jgi:hypothetical protein
VYAFPALLPFARATRRRDWPTLRRLFAELPADLDPTWAVQAAADVKGAERFLAELVDTERESVLPRLLLGTRHIYLAWEARTGARAYAVSRQQATLFHEHLERAERFLGGVTSDDPGNVGAWTERIAAARGLGFGYEEARRRYDMAAKAFPNPLLAQRQMLQTYCPKWGGTFELVHSFARDCADAAPAGAANAALVADGHFEQAAEMRYVSEQMAFLTREPLLRDLSDAAGRSVEHPAFSPQQPGATWARGTFEWVFRYSGQYDRAMVQFTANGTRIGGPWTGYADPGAARSAQRNFCRSRAGKR